MKEFPPFRLDTGNQCLWRRKDSGDEERILLKPTPFAILKYLVDHAGRLVTQEELIGAVWRDTFVQPEVLKRHIFEIRDVLGDDPKIPLFVETLPRRGYQFIAAVRNPASPEPAATDTRAQAKVVGRDRALGELQGYLQKVLGGHRRIVFVTGEPGIGKTTLVDEFQRQAAAGASIRIARGQCVEGYGGKEAYYPMLEALSNLCRGPEGESVVQILAAQAPTWLVQFPSLLKRQQRELLQREILGATRQRMLREIGDALDMITSERPLLLILEDLHWADHSTVDLISALARGRGPAKLLFVGTYRLVDVTLSDHPLKSVKQDLLVHQLCHELALQPLGETEIAAYLASESPDASVPTGLAALLHRHSEGNPLFMVAALEHMTQRGFISCEKGIRKLDLPLEEIDLEVPESLRQMIESQIARLSAEEQRVLEVASLESVGRSRFGVASRAAAIDLQPEAFEDVCEALSRRHSVVRPAGSEEFADGTVSACYEFVHALYREVCYRRISPRRRAQLHIRIGEWAEANLEPLNEAAAWLAGHFEQGGDWPRAVKYLQLAAETAGRRFEPRQAAEILEHTLDLVKKVTDAERVRPETEILEKLATIYVASGDVRAIKTLESLATEADHRGLIDLQARCLLALAYFESWESSQRGLEVFERALQISNLQAPTMQVRTRMTCLSWRIWVAGWNPQDAEACRNAFAEIRQARDQNAFAPHLMEYSLLEWASSEYRNAWRGLVESRLILCENTAQNPYLNYAYQLGQAALPLNLMLLGEWGEALREIKDEIAMFDRNGNYYYGQALRLYLAWVHLHAMDFPAALEICNSAVPLVFDPKPRPEPGYPSPYPTEFRMCLTLMGAVQSALGNHERALELLLFARADMDRQTVIFDWYFRLQFESVLTEVWLAKGELPQARAQAESFLRIALATAERTWQTLAWEVSARIAMAEHDLAKADDYIAKGLSTMEGFELPLAAWRVHATAVELYQGSGDRDSADGHLELSRETITKLANSLPAEEPLRQIFLSSPMVRKVFSETPTLRAKEA